MTIAYQIIGFVAAGFLFGWLFDWLFNFSFPVFRLAFSIAGIVAAMWWLIKTFSKDTDK